MYSDFTSFSTKDVSLFKKKILRWADSFPTFCYFDSNQWRTGHSRFDFIIGIDTLNITDLFSIDLSKNKFQFGFISYDFMAEKYHSNPQKSFVEFEELFFFEPRYIIYGIDERIYVNRNILEALEMKDRIEQTQVDEYQIPKFPFRVMTNKVEYIQNVVRIQEKIREGDFYEMNYCIELRSDAISIHPIDTYDIINQQTAAPMSALVKMNDKWMLSFSPERYMMKKGDKLIAQPIKGTTRRNLDDAALDLKWKESLETSIKERAENSIIVDMMRNDMTHAAIPGSIHVDEYCQVYSFNTVHQMISTISATIPSDQDGLDALLKSLPVASMTGAPKKEVVKNIVEIENFKRGIYAGNIGYIDPNQDFDFSVVIRTLQYDRIQKKASLHIGSAITLLSNPEAEYEECMLKADGILKWFQ